MVTSTCNDTTPERFTVKLSTANGSETRTVGSSARDFLFRMAREHAWMTVEDVPNEERGAQIRALKARINAQHRPLLALTPETRGPRTRLVAPVNMAAMKMRKQIRLVAG